MLRRVLPSSAHPLLRLQPVQLVAAQGHGAYSTELHDAQGCCVTSLEQTRGVLRLAGADLIQYLQGLVTNDVKPLEAAGAPPMYACMLNAQGRHLHDLFLHRLPGDEPAVLVDADWQGLPDLLRLLKRYRLHAKVDIEDMSAEQRVWAKFGASCSSGGWPADARLPELGWRAVLPAEAPGPAASSSGAELVPESAYKLWRVQHGVAEGDTEMPSGEAIALEYNLEGLRGIAFDKGCYVGQELMARTHFKGVVRKRVMPMRLLGDSGGVAVGAAVLPPGGSGKALGTVRVVAGDWALALLRLKPALEAAAAGEQGALEVEGAAGVKSVPVRPAWWSSQWGTEA